jgi:predicted phosphoribosyltransferase
LLAEKIKDTKGETVIVVDDGITSGFTMLVAISPLKKKEPEGIIVAVMRLISFSTHYRSLIKYSEAAMERAKTFIVDKYSQLDTFI